MEAVIIVLLVALLGIAGGAVWLLAARRPAQAAEAQRIEQQLVALKTDLTQTLSTAQQTLLAQMNAVDAKLSQRLDAVQTTMGQSLTATTETIGKIGEQLGGLSQSAERILEVGKQVSSLQDVLQPPKLRGGFGELLLEQLLTQILPASDFTTQYRFKNGEVVDVVIHTPEGLVPIDAKFPLESFRRLLEAPSEEERVRQRRAFMRDVRTRIEEVAKYIRPEENTLDFALMYVPAENVYYEALVGAEDESIMTFALDRHVNLVSPNTFHAFLQALVRGLNGLRVEQNAKEMLARMGQIEREFEKFRQEFDVLGTHVGRAKNKYDDVDRLADRLSSRLSLSLGEPDKDSLSEQAQPSLPEPAAVNGSDEAG